MCGKRRVYNVQVGRFYSMINEQQKTNTTCHYSPYELHGVPLYKDGMSLPVRIGCGTNMAPIHRMA